MFRLRAPLGVCPGTFQTYQETTRTSQKPLRTLMATKRKLPMGPRMETTMVGTFTSKEVTLNMQMAETSLFGVARGTVMMVVILPSSQVLVTQQTRMITAMTLPSIRMTPVCMRGIIPIMTMIRMDMIAQRIPRPQVAVSSFQQLMHFQILTDQSPLA